MKYLMLLLILVGFATAKPSSAVLPWFPELTMHTDSLHMTTAEKKWDIGNSYIVKIVNPTSSTILLRFDTEAGEYPTYIGAGTDGFFYVPSAFCAPWDSVCVKGSGAGTIYIEYWSNR